MKPGDRLVCAFVKPPPIESQFKEWPLHVTIVPWFRTAATSDVLAGEMRTSLTAVEPFEATVGEAEQFGYQKSKTANLINLPTPFMAIEERVRQVLKSHKAWLVDETTQGTRAYKPHVTAQKSARLQADDAFRCGRLYVVEQQGGYKTVESEVRLG